MPFEFDGDRFDHFDKHRFDFGLAFADEVEYEAAADAMLAEPLSGDLHECTRPDGNRVRYRISTNEMAVVDVRGFIRTYFCPDPAIHDEPSNWAYFEAQRTRIFP